MKSAKTLFLTVLAAALTLAGCNQPSGTPMGGAKSGGETAAHAHGKGPNDGVVFVLGKYHAEFTVDHNKKEATILILGDDEKTVTPVAAKDVIVTTTETKAKDGKVVPPMTIKMLPVSESGGKASKFVGTDPGLGNVADFEGTVTAVIDGKPSQGTF
jgi:hypothetical protein